MVTEAIILAGGFGTRLQSVVKEIPKPMASINGKPFLAYLLDYLINQRVQKVALSVGYKYEVIFEYFGDLYNGLKIEYAIEKEPLGTGGGILNALSFCNSENVLLLNGDSYFGVNIENLYQFHIQNASDISLSLKEMHNVDRYGTVSVNKHKIIAFNEKQFIEKGLISCGVYLLDKKSIEKLNLPIKFSFEKDLLETYIKKMNINGITFDNYFIDIGIPEDYERAQIELSQKI